jgi:endonuclease/exonuclease/phosphatase (EEP) superfamily protein YafD
MPASRPVRRVARGAVPVLTGAIAATVVVPDLLGRDRRLPLIATVAWRPQAVVGAAVGAALLAPWRATRPTAAVVAAIAAAGSAGIGSRMRRPTPAAAGSDVLTLLCANVLCGRADTGALAALIEREQPDLVVLPEAGCDYRDKLAPLVAGMGYRGWAATPAGVPDVMGVVVLAGPRAGSLRVRAGSELCYRHLRVSGGILGNRDLLAVHTAAPRNRRFAARWLRDLTQVGRWTRADPAPIVAGDLNATLDNRPLRNALGGCVPAARGVRSLVGTFPSSLPRWFGIQIDHVLVPAATEVVDFAVHDLAQSDHRAVVTRLRLPAEPAPGPSSRR